VNSLNPLFSENTYAIYDKDSKDFLGDIEGRTRQDSAICEAAEIEKKIKIAGRGKGSVAGKKSTGIQITRSLLQRTTLNIGQERQRGNMERMRDDGDMMPNGVERGIEVHANCVRTTNNWRNRRGFLLPALALSIEDSSFRLKMGTNRFRVEQGFGVLR